MSKQPTIKFSLCPIEPHKGEEWEKIQKRKVGEEFTTFRGYTWRKHLYYAHNQGHTFDVLSNGKPVGQAVLKDMYVPLYGRYDGRNTKNASALLQIPADDLWKDTFWDIKDPYEFFARLLTKFYGSPSIVLLRLTFEWKVIE